MSILLKRLNASDDFLTPPELVMAMGEFDLDPCASRRQEWQLARKSYVLPCDGIYHLVEQGKFPAFRMGGILCARQSTIIEYVESQERASIRWFSRLWEYCDAIFFTKGFVRYLCPPGIDHAPGFFGGAFCAIGRESVSRLNKIPCDGVLLENWQRINPTVREALVDGARA